MKTKELIKTKSRELFNQHGVMNITLRDVGKALNKSYGNLTYHYPSKDLLVQDLHKEMNAELLALQAPKEQGNLLSYFLGLPAMSYDITLKYLFFTLDFVEIKRNFPAVFSEVTRLNNERKSSWLLLLRKLHAEGYLRDTLDDADFNYIMLLSGSVRASYFQQFSMEQYNKDEYTQAVNLLLKPYLSQSGLDIFYKF